MTYRRLLPIDVGELGHLRWDSTSHYRCWRRVGSRFLLDLTRRIGRVISEMRKARGVSEHGVDAPTAEVSEITVFCLLVNDGVGSGDGFGGSGFDEVAVGAGQGELSDGPGCITRDRKMR